MARNVPGSCDRMYDQGNEPWPMGIQAGYWNRSICALCTSIPRYFDDCAEFQHPDELICDSPDFDQVVVDVLETHNMNLSPAQRTFVARLIAKAQPAKAKPATAGFGPSDVTSMTMEMFKQCSQMIRATTPAPQATAPPPTTKVLQVTNVAAALEKITYAGPISIKHVVSTSVCVQPGLDEAAWPSEKLMIKLESFPKGRFTYIKLVEWAKPAWNIADENVPAKRDGKPSYKSNAPSVPIIIVR